MYIVPTVLMRLIDASVMRGWAGRRGRAVISGRCCIKVVAFLDRAVINIMDGADRLQLYLWGPRPNCDYTTITTIDDDDGSTIEASEPQGEWAALWIVVGNNDDVGGGGSHFCSFCWKIENFGATLALGMTF